jgi:hypothetical protein
MDWSKVSSGAALNPLLLASLAANAAPVPDASAGAADNGKAEGEGLAIAPGASLEGGVAVLLDAMRRHNEEGCKDGAKNGITLIPKP